MPKAAALLLAAACLAGCGGSAGRTAAPPPPPFNWAELHPARPAPPLALRDQDGRLVRLASLRGKTVFVTFLYTHCPDVCPLIAVHLNSVLRRLGAARSGVRVLAVSVDPRGDTRASVRRFVRVHGLLPQFRYLTGTRAQLIPVWRAYGIVVQASPEATVGHSSYTLLVDRDGRRRLLYDAQAKPAPVLADLRRLEHA